MVAVRLDHLSKRLDGDVLAVDDVSLAVGSGELLGLLGPSGCGKTTLLRLIAGLEAPTSGRVLFANRNVGRRPPERRDIGLVPQSHALFPHLSVGENVAFGLSARDVSKKEASQRVAEVLAQVRLDGFEGRPVDRLSLGEQQRVALARALVLRPRLLLLDDPLASLDDRLREELRATIRQLQRVAGITTIFASHDQAEVLAISDRIAVMQAGRIEQAGAPGEVYERPATHVVATFLGRANLLPGMVALVEERMVTVALRDGSIVRVEAGRWGPEVSVGIGASVTVVVRPEELQIATEDGPGTIVGTVVSARRTGAFGEYVLDVQGQPLQVTLLGNRIEARPGEQLRVTVRPDGAFLLE